MSHYVIRIYRLMFKARETQAKRNQERFRYISIEDMALRRERDDSIQATSLQRRAQRLAQLDTTQASSSDDLSLVVLNLPLQTTLLGLPSGVSLPTTIHALLISIKEKYDALLKDMVAVGMDFAFRGEEEGDTAFFERWSVEIGVTLRESRNGLDVVNKQRLRLREFRERGVSIHNEFQGVFQHPGWAPSTNITSPLHSWSLSLSQGLHILRFLDMLVDHEILRWSSAGQWSNSPHPSVKTTLIQACLSQFPLLPYWILTCTVR